MHNKIGGQKFKLKENICMLFLHGIQCTTGKKIVHLEWKTLADTTIAE